MKPAIIILFLAFFSNICFAQDSTIQKSKYEAFVSKDGKMMKQETFNVANNKDYKIEVWKATNLETNESIKSILLLQEKNYFLVGKIAIMNLYIDWDEAEGFLKALKFQLPLLETKPTNNVSYTYSTNNGVQSSISYFSKDLSGISAGWYHAFSRVYKYSREIISNSVFQVKKKDLPDIISLIENALKKDY